MDIAGIALSGLHQAHAAFQGAARRIADPVPTGSENAASLPGDTVTLIHTKNQFAADLKAIKVADELEKATIDLIG
jgi:hypothetical protein